MKNQLTRISVLMMSITIVSITLLACKSQTKISEEIWQHALGKLQAKVDRTAFRVVADSGAVDSVDFFVTHDNWFAVIFSARTSNSVAFLPIIGYLKSDRVYHAYARRPKLIIGDEAERYRNLARGDSLWTIVWDEPFWFSSQDFQDAYNAGMEATTGGRTYLGSSIGMDMSVD